MQMSASRVIADEEGNVSLASLPEYGRCEKKLKISLSTSNSNKTDEKNVLPKEHTEALMKRIKKLVSVCR